MARQLWHTRFRSTSMAAMRASGPVPKPQAAGSTRQPPLSLAKSRFGVSPATLSWMLVACTFGSSSRRLLHRRDLLAFPGFADHVVDRDARFLNDTDLRCFLGFTMPLTPGLPVESFISKAVT
jgi:hypothetical protein